MSFDIEKLKVIKNFSLTEDDIKKIRKGIKKYITEEQYNDLLVAVQNICAAEEKQEAMIANFIAIARVIITIALLTV